MPLTSPIVSDLAVAIYAEQGLKTIVADRSKTDTITSVSEWRPALLPDVERSAGAAAWIAALLLTGALTACAGNGAYERCRTGGCSSDANITANVQGLLAQHPELQGPDQIYVKTVDHVVYLSGTVETGMQRSIAASVAREVSGVSRVVNDVAVEN